MPAKVIRVACGVVRDLQLLPNDFDRIANCTIDQMSKEDVKALAQAMRSLAGVLDEESAARS